MFIASAPAVIKADIFGSSVWPLYTSLTVLAYKLKTFKINFDNLSSIKLLCGFNIPSWKSYRSLWHLRTSKHSKENFNREF